VDRRQVPGVDAGGRAVDDSHRVSRPFYCGAVDVPIYVDTTTIRLQSTDDDATDALYITARMKVLDNRNAADAAVARLIVLIPPSHSCLLCLQWMSVA